MKTIALQFENEKQARNILNNLVNEKVEVWCTGVRVEGIVKKFEEDKYTFKITVDHRDVQWSNNIYTTSTISVRKHDGMWMSGISIFK